MEAAKAAQSRKRAEHSRRTHSYAPQRAVAAALLEFLAPTEGGRAFYVRRTTNQLTISILLK